MHGYHRQTFSTRKNSLYVMCQYRLQVLARTESQLHKLGSSLKTQGEQGKYAFPGFTEIYDFFSVSGILGKLTDRTGIRFPKKARRETGFVSSPESGQRLLRWHTAPRPENRQGFLPRFWPDLGAQIGGFLLRTY